MKATKLRITSLKFISAVDAGAQGPIANVALIKRAPTGDKYSLTAKVAKLDESLGVVFGYAVASTVNGGKSAHVDLQGDAVAGGDELIKVALAFAEAGAASDVMHDCAKDGWCPFVMPLSDDTKKAFKLSGDVEGIAIGMKPSTETFKRFVSGELGAFSIFGEGIRTPLDEAKRAPGRIAKEAVLTSTDDGHAHTVSLDDPARYWCDQLQTSYQTSEGADAGHSHAWVFGPDGKITIAEDSGHSHTIDAVVPPDVLAVYAAREARRDAENLAEAAAPALINDDPSDGVPTAVAVEESSGSARVVVINARAPANKSTHRTAKAQGGSHTKETIMANETDAKIADLTKRNERLERIAKLSGAHKAHFDTLTGDAQDEFLAKAAADRDAVLADVIKRAEEAEKVVYTSTTTGVVYKAKDDPRLIDMAKRLDEQAQTIEKADIRKQAVEVLGGMPGDDATHDAIIGALRKSLTGESLDKAVATLKGMKAESRIGKSAAGVSGGVEPSGNVAMDAFNKGLTEFAKAKGKDPVLVTNDFIHTNEGAALYAAIQA